MRVLSHPDVEGTTEFPDEVAPFWLANGWVPADVEPAAEVELSDGTTLGGDGEITTLQDVADEPQPANGASAADADVERLDGERPPADPTGFVEQPPANTEPPTSAGRGRTTTPRTSKE